MIFAVNFGMGFSWPSDASTATFDLKNPQRNSLGNSAADRYR